ncbi:hypothetical protein [Cellulomonas cellasea]|uniref:Uncharacterized protein n=1 Tax=Cellulomonas cellasea TaxID=43670 RepID=A0A7W4UH63_9CELL|nr:hypothetical protein [Cellulomonas cellasea]MBB2924088.1 hypothetical protein [Cellulomonas cellasea]
MASFTSERSDAIRAHLINHVAENRPPRRRRAVWGAGFLVAGALVGAGTSAAALAATGTLDPAPRDVQVQLRVPNYGPAPDHVLELEGTGADVDEPKDPHGTLDLLGLSTTGLQEYEDFRGLSVWSGASRYDTDCLLVAHPGQGLLEGIGDAQCSPDGVDTIADVPLCSGCSAPHVFAGMPTGSLIRFVLQGDHVDVYVYVRARDRSEPEG